MLSLRYLPPLQEALHPCLVAAPAAGEGAVQEAEAPAAAGKKKGTDFSHCLLSGIGIFLHYESRKTTAEGPELVASN